MQVILELGDVSTFTFDAKIAKLYQIPSINLFLFFNFNSINSKLKF